jgi:hypothetical protein
MVVMLDRIRTYSWHLTVMCYLPEYVTDTVPCGTLKYKMDVFNSTYSCGHKVAFYNIKWYSVT